MKTSNTHKTIGKMLVMVTVGMMLISTVPSYAGDNASGSSKPRETGEKVHEFLKEAVKKSQKCGEEFVKGWKNDSKETACEKLGSGTKTGVRHFKEFMEGVIRGPNKK